MPWNIVEGGEDCPFEVVKEDSGEHVACHPSREKAEAHMKALYANEPEMMQGAHSDGASPSVEYCSRAAATLGDVNFSERIITIVAVPYEEPTPVEYRGQWWNEVFSRSAFNGLEARMKRRDQKRIPVVAHFGLPESHSHDGAHLIGKVVQAFPDRPEGLVLDLKVSETAAGDEALVLARDDALSPSVGYGVRPGDYMLEKRSMTRRINRAFLDHLAMVSQQAFAGARVIAMRSAQNQAALVPLEQLSTPKLDEFVGDPIFEWAAQRLEARADSKKLSSD